MADIDCRKFVAGLAVSGVDVFLAGCGLMKMGYAAQSAGNGSAAASDAGGMEEDEGARQDDAPSDADAPDSAPAAVNGAVFAEGSMVDRGFVVDNTLDVDGRTLHFGLHVPDSYDGSVPYALYISCPGWEGLWFQGVGANLVEDFPFVANDYIPDMIVALPQFDDWGDQLASDCIALTEWLLATYSIDPDRVYLSGNSGGGETISRVLGRRPELYRRALHTISQWDGDIDVLTQAQVPVYLAIGEHDDYYGPVPDRTAYQSIVSAYRAQGLSDEEVSRLIVLDVKPDSYFTDRGRAAGASQHAGGGALFPHDPDIMGWFFERS